MAVAKVKKVLIVAHNSEKKALLASLQENGIIHISKVRKETKGSRSELVNEAEETIKYLENILAQKKRKKVEIERREFFIEAEKEILSLITEINRWREELVLLNEREKSIKEKLETLRPFSSLSTKIEDLYSLEKFETILGFFPTKKSFIETRAKASEGNLFLEEIKREEDKVFALIITLKENEREVREFLSNQGFTIVDLRALHGSVAENIKNWEEETKRISERRSELTEKRKDFFLSLPFLKIGADYYYNQKIREELEKRLFQTEKAIMIEGWVKERDEERLKRIIASFPTSSLIRLKPNPDEEPPVALENKPPFQPFEMVVNLYGMPSYKEIDPTPYLTPFFIIFFALCLSDAAYGLILFFLSLFLSRKFPKAKSFFTLTAICSIFTIFAGAATNSWFGDFFERVGIPFLKTFKDRFVLFDPFQNPLTFFYLSLALGYLHLNYGLLLEVYDSFRIKNPLPTLFNEFLWFILLNSLLFYLLLGKTLPSLKPLFFSFGLLSASGLITLSRYSAFYLSRHILFFLFLSTSLFFLAFRLKFLPPSFLFFKYLSLAFFLSLIASSLLEDIRLKKLSGAKIIIYSLSFGSFLTYLAHRFSVLPFLLFGALAIFLSPSNRKLLKGLIWGAYNLYGGTSFLGIVLSYIRLMALGMMTAGIGMAVNSIAWMTLDIPILGLFIAIIVLIIGHTYNLAVSILGAFVHTLRLNYVEFFPRFFTGGGERFSPFRFETKYVEIK